MSWQPFRSNAARLVACAVLAGGVAGAAQDPQTPARQTPQFKAGVDVVEVDVTVLDKAGRPVTDLTAADFEVRERGELQRIDTIYLVSEAAPAPLAPGLPAPPPTPGSRVATRTLPQRVFVFVIDMAHLSAAGFDRSRNAIRSFLADGLRPVDLAGVVVNGEMLGNRIQSDKQELLKLVDALGPPNLSRFNDMRQWPRILSEQEASLIVSNNAQARDQAVRRACAERPEDCLKTTSIVESEIENKSRLIVDESARDALTALTVLQTLANGLGRFSGPKHVVLLSEGFYTGDFAERVTQIAGLAARNRVRVSTLDARGLNTDPRQQNLFDASPVAGTGDLALLGSDLNADVLTTLALETGGQRVRNHNNLRPPLDSIARESGTYYVIGYSPEQRFDGSYRSIDVKVLRPDVTVRARRGYLATPQARPDAAGAAPSVPSPPPATAAGPPPSTTGVISPPPVPSAPAPPTTPGALDAAPPAIRLRPDASPNIGAVAKRIADPAEAGSERATALGRAGWDLYAAGKVEEARDRLAEALAAGGGPWVDYALGYAEFALRHFDAAMSAWQRVRSHRPDYRPVYFDLADAYLQLGKSDEAVKVLRDAAGRWPAESEPHNAVGVVLVSRGALDEAIESFSRAVAADPRDDTGHFNLGRAYHLRYFRRLQSGASSPTAARAVADRDRQSALDAYKTCAALEGPFARQARDGIALLEWRR